MLTELRPSKDLLDSNFSGYKLSLDPIPVYRQSIVEGVDHVGQSEDQYSFIHTKLFSLHNHLYCDPWRDNTVVFIDNKWQVIRASVLPETGRVDGLQTVWKLPHQNQRRVGHFNTSVLFPSRDIALVADGCGRLHILDCANDTWQCEHSLEVTADCGNVLMTAAVTAEAALHCVLLSLEAITTDPVSSADPNKPRPASVKSVLHWLTLKKVDGGTWSVECTRQLEGAGAVDYVALEPTGAALYVASNTTFAFSFDSANPLPPSAEKTNNDELNPPAYTWQQSEDDIKVVVEVADGVTRDQIDVKVEAKLLMICCGTTTIVEGPLLYTVDHKLTTWSLQDNRLEVTLTKQEVGLMWSELVPSDTTGRQVIDPAVVEEVHSRLSHLCSDTQVKESGEGVAPTFNLDQLEECDSAPEDSRSLVRLEPETHSVSHYISLAGHQWLTAVLETADYPACVCVRHDVDGCVWRLDPPSSTSAEWPCKHVGTFAALGYVAASKTQRKFLVAAQDLSYAVICEAASRVYVYRKATKVNGELRNRKTSARFETVAKQQLINLETDSPVLGVYASPTYLFILTNDTLYTFHIQ
ncbi:nudC domain-containing protein 1 [Macrosteles quadrilineatus]|uniref:nudC domain-containing protein 1 n=1 Tax=Macrosteles quadrilineatus TaxID=74068 RepID=UPI0023E30398|nr:nudC domain-containing protein 1 [Macrosteles quadrilineatus]